MRGDIIEVYKIVTEKYGTFTMLKIITAHYVAGVMNLDLIRKS